MYLFVFLYAYTVLVVFLWEQPSDGKDLYFQRKPYLFQTSVVLYCMYVFSGIQCDTKVVGVIKNNNFGKRKYLVVLKPVEATVVKVLPSLTPVNTICVCYGNIVAWNELPQ